MVSPHRHGRLQRLRLSVLLAPFCMVAAAGGVTVRTPVRAAVPDGVPAGYSRGDDRRRYAHPAADGRRRRRLARTPVPVVGDQPRIARDDAARNADGGPGYWPSCCAAMAEFALAAGR